MSNFLLIFFFLLSFVFIFSSQTEEEEKKAKNVVIVKNAVIDLDDESFDSQLNAKKGATWLIKFYAPWCGHCKHLEPVYKETAAALSGTVFVARVDATKYPDLGQRFKIRSYPTIFVVINAGLPDSILYTYEGERSVKAFSNFASAGYNDAVGVDFPVVGKPPADDAEVDESDVVILTDANYTSIAMNNNNTNIRWFVMFYAPWCGHCKHMKPAWASTASALVATPPAQLSVIRMAKIDGTLSREAASRFKVKGFPTIVLIKNASSYAEYTGERSEEDLFDFVSTFDENESSMKFLAIPPLPTFKDELIDVALFLATDLQQMIQHKKLALFIVFVLGVIVGVILLACLSPMPAAAIKQQQQQRVASKANVEISSSASSPLSSNKKKNNNSDNNNTKTEEVKKDK